METSHENWRNLTPVYRHIAKKTPENLREKREFTRVLVVTESFCGYVSN